MPSTLSNGLSSFVGFFSGLKLFCLEFIGGSLSRVMCKSVSLPIIEVGFLLKLFVSFFWLLYLFSMFLGFVLINSNLIKLMLVHNCIKGFDLSFKDF